MKNNFFFVSGQLWAFLILTSVFFVLNGCDRDDEPTPPETGPATMHVAFTPVFEGEEVGIKERFVNAQDCAVEMLNLKFYLSNIQLHGSNGTTTISDIEFYDIRNDKTSWNFEIPDGNYTGISFDLGVPQHLNGTANPDFLISVYDPLHPLSESNGMYWVWQTGYRFFTIEGRYDTLPQSGESLPNTFAFHTGRDTLFRNVEIFEREFTAGPGSATALNFSVDLGRLFKNESSEIDLRVEHQYHGALANIEVGIRMANNSAAAFKLLP